MTGKTAFVTGATGFVGLNLVEQLAGQGWQIAALHRPSSDTAPLRRFPVRLATGSLDDPGSLTAAMPHRVDAVFHVAANTSIWSRHNAEQTRDNVDGTRNVVRAALAAGARRFVHTSTWNVYGLEQESISEDSPQLGGASWINYNRTKYLAEQEVRRGIAEGLPAVIVNPSHVMGRYDPGSWSRMIALVDRNALPGIPPGAGSFCHAEAVARAHIAAAERGRVGENYLLGGTDASFVEAIGLIGELLGRKVPRKPLPAWLLRSMARFYTLRAALTGRQPELTPEGAAMVLAHPRIVSRKAQTELDYRPVPLRLMLEDCIAWMRAEGLIGT